LMNEGQLYDTYLIGQDINTGKLIPIMRSDEKFDQLMGLSIGQNVENSSLFGLYGGTLKVGSIRSLAQYSFSESTVILRRNNLLYSINFNPENPEELHNTLGNVVSDQEDNTMLLSMNPKITVNILAKIYHLKVFNIVDQLYRDANETIYTGNLTIEEFQKAIRNLGALDSHDIIFDAATLVFCSELGILEFIERFPRKILLSGKTLADLSIGDAEIESGIGSLASHCASIAHTWAKEHTLTVSSLYEGSFDIVAEELLHGESLFSMYSAIGNNAVMITVDPFIRMNIEQQGGIALDLQFLLKWLYNNRFITVDELIDTYLRMRNAGFFLVSINAELVISALSEYLKYGNVSNAYKIAEILSEEKIDFLSLIGVLTPSYNLVNNTKDSEKFEKCLLWLESITDLISYRNPNFPKYTPSEYIDISKMSLNLELCSMLQYNGNV
ncbi:MAG: hypothetical protein Q8R86_01610, partial [Sulfuricurvum sp.]|nr:hypothetical protein [Sulfuricurvum sp.]